MGTPILRKKSVVLGKLETEYGDGGGGGAPAVATDDIMVEDPMMQIAHEPNKREGQRETLSRLRDAEGSKTCTFDCSAEFKTSGAMATVGAAEYCEIAPLLCACGLERTINAGAGGRTSYVPRSSGFQSVAIHHFRNADAITSSVLGIAKGCVGNVSFSLEAGKIPRATFSLQGLYTKPADSATDISGYSAALDASLPKMIESIVCTIDDYATAVVRKLTIDLGNEIARRNDVNSAEGVAGFCIVGRNPKATLTVEALLASVKDFWQLVDEGDTLAVTAVVSNGDVDNRLYFSLPTCTPDNITWSDDGGIWTVEIPLSLYGDDNEILIVEGTGTTK